MKEKTKLTRHLPAVAAFLLVTAGTALALPRGGDGTTAASLVPTVVARAEIPAGTRSDEMRELVKLTGIPAGGRAEGALSSLDDIPDGVLLATHVPGQQVLTTSFAATPVAALGEGYVAVSMSLDPQRWTGPLRVTGQRVDIYGIESGGAVLLSPGAVVLDPSTTSDAASADESVVTFGIKEDTVSAVLLAASDKRIWLVGR